MAVVALALAVGLTIFLAVRSGIGAGDALPEELPGTTTITADEFTYDPQLVEAAEGATLRLRNEGAIYHDLRIDGVDGFALEALPGADDMAEIDLAPGRYVFYCSVPGHLEAGMVGELQVG